MGEPSVLNAPSAGARNTIMHESMAVGQNLQKTMIQAGDVIVLNLKVGFR